MAEERDVLQRVRVRVAAAEDMKWFAAKIEAHHYLGWKDPVGERVAHVAEVEGRPLALLLWAAGSYHLRVRDEWIGWTQRQRRERLALVVNNSRFLVSEDFYEHHGEPKQLWVLPLRQMSFTPLAEFVHCIVS